MLGYSSLLRYLDDALACLGTPFAQLIWLSSLRDHYSGRYLHEGWANCSSSQEVHALLRQTHLRIFEDAVKLPLVSLCNELRLHFHMLEESETRAVRLWLELQPFSEMIPEGTTLLLRRMFTSQLQLALEVLSRAPGWAYLQEPSALPPPRLGQQSPLQLLN